MKKALCSTVLPPDAVRQLQRAAQTPIFNDLLARVKAIEKATARVKTQFPQFFRE